MRNFFIAALLALGCGLALTGCLADKAVACSNGIDGLKVETTGSASSGSMPMPNVWYAQDCFSYASAPSLPKDATTQVVFTYAKKRSFLGSLFGVDDTAETMSYIGAPNETANDTEKRVKALRSVPATSEVKSATGSTTATSNVGNTTQAATANVGSTAVKQ